MKREKIDWTRVTFTDVTDHEKGLRAMLELIGVPELRRDARNLRNLRWLNRNLMASWGHHVLAEAAHDSVVWLLRWEARMRG